MPISKTNKCHHEQGKESVDLSGKTRMKLLLFTPIKKNY